MEWILSQFNDQNCPQLKGKPKFFVFNACRGDKLDEGVWEKDGNCIGRSSQNVRIYCSCTDCTLLQS